MDHKASRVLGSDFFAAVTPAGGISFPEIQRSHVKVRDFTGENRMPHQSM